MVPSVTDGSQLIPWPCVDVPASTLANGARVDIRTCDTRPKRWRFG
jgi:hypothetical protein